MHFCVLTVVSKSVAQAVVDSKEFKELEGSARNDQDLKQTDFIGQISTAITSIVGKLTNLGSGYHFFRGLSSGPLFDEDEKLYP